MDQPKVEDSIQRSPHLFIPAKIGIIGYGIVGQALAHGLNQKSQGKDRILFYDKFKKGDSLEEVVKKSEFFFICLPTPMKNGRYGIDISIIEENIAKIAPPLKKSDKIIIIKSTVVPGTTKKFEKKYPGVNFCFNPEFLTEANSLQDFLNSKETIIGANNDLILRRVSMLYQSRFTESKIILTDSTTAEVVKYFRNALLALKVGFANVMYDLCNAHKINYDQAKEIAVMDLRLGDSHLGVTTLRGFGGKCFPKDLSALIGEAEEKKVDASLLKALWDYNLKIRSIRDWEEIPFAVADEKSN